MLFLDFLMAAAAVKSLQLCPTLCDPWTACSPPGSSTLGFSGKGTGVGAMAFSVLMANSPQVFV